MSKKVRRIVVGAALLALVVPIPFVLAAGAPPVDGYGPWRFAMTRGEVQAEDGFGPYRPVQSTGGLETFDGEFEGETTHISFVFGETGLHHIQIWVYAGSGAAEAVDAFYRAYRHLHSKFGQVATHGRLLAADLDLESFAQILPSDLADDSEEVELDRLQELGSIQVRPSQFHLHPAEPPAGAQVYASLIKSPQVGLYHVFVYYKLP